jgi:hypothetical protein
MISWPWKKSRGNKKIPRIKSKWKQNMWGTAKADLRGKFIPMNDYSKIKIRSQIT